MSADYRYHLALSSQFPFCGIPLRLDAYSRCQFACRYCFASARGGATGERKIRVADPERLARRLNRLACGAPAASVLDEMLQARVPIHFGGMSDPFMPMERERGITLALLKTLAAHAYPALISTKGVLPASEPYLSLLARPNFAVQFSITTASDTLSRKVDAGAPTTSERFNAMLRLSEAGAKTAVRHQPLLPTRTFEAAELVERSASAGARHYAVEHLKLPVEAGGVQAKLLSEALGLDLHAHYAQANATRVGREWVLPVSERLSVVLDLKIATHAAGLSFGAADSDLLHLSDGAVCCSGADLLGLGSGLQFNFLAAVRSGLNGAAIRFDSIAASWRPVRPISEYVNSHSRAPNQDVTAFLRARWNGAANGPSPAAFHGVLDTGETDLEGLKIYLISPAVVALGKV